MTKWYRWLLAPVDVLALATTAKAFRDNPVMGSPTLNRYGLHLLRREIARRAGVRRRAQLSHLISPTDRAAFERDGYLVKENYLDKATFEALRDEIMGLRAPAREFVDGYTMTRLIPLDAANLEKLPAARQVLKAQSYRGLLDYIGSFRRRPHLFIQTVFSRFRDAKPDVQSYFHSDTFHPTVKSWLFLNDVGEDEAAFTYVPGSHRANRRRLAWERKASMEAARSPDPLCQEGSLRILERDLRHLGYPAPRRLAAAANTLIIADTSGFHARGIPSRASTRVSIWAYSRSNPFLPWVSGDLAALPFLQGRAVRLFWAVQDLSKRLLGVSVGWRWAGIRTPLTPPEQR